MRLYGPGSIGTRGGVEIFLNWSCLCKRSNKAPNNFSRYRVYKSSRDNSILWGVFLEINFICFVLTAFCFLAVRKYYIQNENRLNKSVILRKTEHRIIKCLLCLKVTSIVLCNYRCIKNYKINNYIKIHYHHAYVC